MSKKKTEEVYNTPQKLDRDIRWMIACQNSKEGWQDGKEAKDS